MSNYEARQWYLTEDAQILNRIDSTAPLEVQARQAFDLRNDIRTQAREFMSDRITADRLYREEPNLTWEQITTSKQNRGLSGKKGGNPDLDINTRPADVYSPKSKNPNTIRDNIEHKVGHQAPDVVLNVSDSPLSSTDMLKFLGERPVNGLQNLYLIDGETVLLRRF